MTAIGPVEEHEFRPDIEIVALIAAIPAILTVVSRVTGMGFSAVARVTPDRWVCLAANDEIGFGLKPGGELKVETTICHEIRQSGGEVVIDHVGRDEVYRNHHTPAMYGFESYISVPIVLRDGSFYGTLCAIDPKPAKLNDPGIIGMFPPVCRIHRPCSVTICAIRGPRSPRARGCCRKRRWTKRRRRSPI
jgi:GAF domain-containing protein